MKAIIAANVALFVITELLPGGRVLQTWLGLVPSATITQLRIWQPATYMFLHAGLFHLLFNMLALWMFGTELERLWGRRYFLKFYFVCGIGAGVLTVLFSLLPFTFSNAALRLDRDRRLGRDLRSAARLRLVLPGSADPDVHAVSDPGEVLRHDHRRDRLLLVAGRDGRCRQRDPSRRSRRRLTST